jgi:STE24 endopeptidase
MLVLPVFTFVFAPLASYLSRRHEFEADAFAARHASAADLVNALVKLYEDNAATLTPDPIHSAFYDSHPPASLRVARLSAPAAT